MGEQMLDAVCITIDVDWSSPEVLGEMISALDQRGLRATVFCTHPGIEVPGHERALHPNFRRSGQTVRSICAELAPPADCPDDFFYPHIMARTKAFCPEAVGTRSHSLYYDSLMLPYLAQIGMQYDSSCLLPLARGMQPVWKEYGILEMPIYFNDHFEMKSNATGFDVKRLCLDAPGMKILQFHPNMAFINARDHDHYMSSKPHYHDAQALAALRHHGRGAGTFFLDVIDQLARSGRQTMTLAEVNRLWRAEHPAPWQARGRAS